MLRRAPKNRLVTRRVPKKGESVELAFTWQRKMALFGAVTCAGLVGLLVVYRGHPAPVSCVLEQVAPLWVGYEEARGGWSLGRFDFLKCRGLTASLLEVEDERKTLVKEVVQQIRSHKGDLTEFQQGGFLGVAERVVPAFGKEPGFVPDRKRAATTTTAAPIGSPEEVFPQEDLTAEPDKAPDTGPNLVGDQLDPKAPQDGVSKPTDEKESSNKLAAALTPDKTDPKLELSSPSLKALEDAAQQLPAAMTAALGLRIRAAGTLVHSLVLRREALMACAKDKQEVISQYRNNLELPFAVATMGKLGLPITQTEAMMLAEEFLKLSEEYTMATGTLQVSCPQAETYLYEMNLFVAGNHPLLPGCRVLEDEGGLRLQCE